MMLKEDTLFNLGMCMFHTAVKLSPQIHNNDKLIVACTCIHTHNKGMKI